MAAEFRLVTLPTAHRVAKCSRGNYHFQQHGNFKPQNFANTAWAHNTLGMKAPLYFSAFAEAAVRKLDEYTPHNIVNTAWAYATVDIEAPLAFNAIAKAGMSKLDEFQH